MTNAKDTFYLMLRDRLAALNPSRTISLRGVSRPGVLVEENELATNEVIADVFRLRWMAQKIDMRGALPLVAMSCEVRYGTDGTVGNAGMDRGRLLTQMDAELSTALRTEPHNASKMNYAGSGFGKAPVAMMTNVFWSDAVFLPAITASERLERTATVEVFCYQEAGEL